MMTNGLLQAHARSHHISQPYGLRIERRPSFGPGDRPWGPKLGPVIEAGNIATPLSQAPTIGMIRQDSELTFALVESE